MFCGIIRVCTLSICEVKKVAYSYEDLIPDSLYDERIPVSGKYDFLYMGRESIAKMRDLWMADAELYADCGMSAASIETRMLLVSEAQHCREQAQKLEELMADAESKPSIFRELPTVPMSRVTCALPETGGVYVNCVLLRTMRDENGKLVYEVKTKDGRTVCFCPDSSSVVPTEDWPYLKCHPNFFAFYRSIGVKPSRRT